MIDLASVCKVEHCQERYFTSTWASTGMYTHVQVYMHKHVQPMEMGTYTQNDVSDVSERNCPLDQCEPSEAVDCLKYGNK